MYRIVCERSFDSAHQLIGYEGKCKDLHGHTWKFVADFIFIGQLDKVGISVDFKVVKEILKGISEEFDHKYLNEIFKEENPTAEVISKRIYKMLEQRIKEAGLRLLVNKVSLWETPDNCIIYSED